MTTDYPAKLHTPVLNVDPVQYCNHCEENYHMWDIIVNEHGYQPELSHRVLDLGGWYGHFTFYCASRGAKVMVLEPVPHHFNRLVEKLGKERWMDNVRAVNAAVDVHSGWGRIRVPDNNRAASFYRDGEEIPVQTVEMKGLLEQGWDCVKVDIEGAEKLLIDADLSQIAMLTLEMHNDVLTKAEHDDILATIQNQFPHYQVWDQLSGGVSIGRVAKVIARRDQ